MTYNPSTSHGVLVGSLNDAGGLALSDVDVVNRGGVDYRTTMTARVALMRKTPAGSRTASLPAVLTAADHDKNVILTGTTGNLSVDGTVTDGFRTHVINQATGAATYSGITGLLGTTSLVSGGIATVLMGGATVYASAGNNTTVSTVTAYTTTLSAASAATGSPVTMTFTPTAGAWPVGAVLTPSATGTLAGTFSPTSLTLIATTAAVTITYTPSSASGTSGTLTSATTGTVLTNTTGALAFSVTTATATSYTMTQSATSGVTGSDDTLTFTPVGNWPSGVTITLAVANVSASFINGTGGSLSGSVLTPPAGTTTACTVAMRPSTSGTASITSSNSGSMSNPTALTYTVSVAGSAGSYSMTESAASGVVNQPVTLTFTPISGNWPSQLTLAPSSTVAGTFSPTTLSPTAGVSTPVACTFTPSTTSGSPATLSVGNSIALTDPSPLTYTVNPIATAYTTALSTTSGVAGVAVTMTFTPTTAGWPYGEVITPTQSGVSGVFSPTTITTTAGSTAGVTCTFTPSTTGTAALSSTTSPSLTNTTGSQNYTVSAGYPTLTQPGVISGSTVSRLAIYDASVLSGATGDSALTLVDQSGNGHNLVASVGPTLGPLVNGNRSIQFPATKTQAANSGFIGTGAWLDQLRQNPHTIVLVTKPTAATLAAQEWVYIMGPGSTTSTNDTHYNSITGSGADIDNVFFGATAKQGQTRGSTVANTVYRKITRIGWGDTTSGASNWYSNSTTSGSTTNMNGAGVVPATTWNQLIIGQSPGSAIGAFGAADVLFCEMHVLLGLANNTDVTTYMNSLLTKWGS